MSNSKMFLDTQKLITQRVAQLKKEMLEAAEEKRYSGHTNDGDMMDDPIMHQQMEKIGLMQAQVVKLESYLQSDINFIKPSRPSQEAVIEIGHRVQLKVTYADGEKEVYFATIGTAIDYSFMGSNKDYFDGQYEVMISEDSSLGQKLLGAKLHENLIYDSPGGKNTVTILDFQISPFAQE